MSGYRVAIVGGPSCGKTTRAYQLAGAHRERTGEFVHVYSTDSTMQMPWADQAYFWLSLQYLPGNWILEGIQTARVLRKGLNVHKVIPMFEPKKPLDKKQQSTMKGIIKVWNDVKHGRMHD